MNRHLLLLIAISLLLVSWFINYYGYLRTWITRFRSQPSLAKRRCKNKSHPFPFPTKRPECPLCQAEEALPSKVTPPEPPPLIPHKRGRRRSIYTDLRFCPNNDCEYYGWFARGVGNASWGYRALKLPQNFCLIWHVSDRIIYK